MSLYLLLNTIIVAIPLILTFAPKVYYYRKIKALAFSITAVGSLFVLWDVLASARGDWTFNKEYIEGFGILGLPYEELLFFITVPYSCLFLYETFRTYIKEGPFPYSRYFYGILAFLCIFGAAAFIDKTYTSTVLLISALIFASAIFCFKRVFTSRIYWIYILVCTALFALFNHFLTSMPVVMYSGDAITGLRIGTIPIEDFIYNFSLLSLYSIFYLFAKEKWGRSVSQ